MDWVLPTIVLFGALVMGLSMIPSIISDFIKEVKDAFSTEERVDAE